MKLQLSNTHLSYGLFAISVHWLMVVGIVFLFCLGLYMVDLGYYDPWYKQAPDLHRSIGLIVFFLWCLRVALRLRSIKPKPLGSPTENKLASIAHKFLYLLPLLLVVTGYLISTADGRPVAFFTFFAIPALPLAVENQEDIAGLAHWILALSLITIASLHGLAAIKHHFINKDATLRRMLRP